MNLRQVLSTAALSAAVIATTFGISQAGAQDVDPHLHPNLAKAQHSIDQALEFMDYAQKANDFDMKGHAAKAKQLLEEADREIKMAGMTANKR